MNVNLNRFNRVLIKYYVQDDIDQGEVWSPILWRIFYDALLIRLEEVKKKDRL